MIARLEEVLDRSYHQVIRRAERDCVSHRTVAMAIGVTKVRNAKDVRGP